MGSALTSLLDVVFAFVMFAVMWFYSPTLTYIVLASVPLYIALSVAVTPALRRRIDEKFARGAENQTFLVESIVGVETIKAMAVEPQMQRRWEDQLAGYVMASFRAVSLGNLASHITQLINKAVTVGTLWYGAQLVIGGELSVGQLIAFNMLAGRVAAPVLRLAQLWQEFQQVRVSVDRLGDVLNTATEVFGGTSSMLKTVGGRVLFDHVTFRYSAAGAEILSDVTLAVEPGEVIGIVGPSGSGKSTFAKLIQRLYTPVGGRVLVDGVDLAMADPRWLRRQIGVVLQENILFHASVRDNIALADPSLPFERVVEAAKLSGAHDFILKLPQGYDTILEERGSNLSGGQRQRVAIARALITNPRILIFDEATSALDYESEYVIQQNMARITAGRTVFIIAHRLAAIRTATRIITIESGRIVEQGTHAELLGKQGRYASLWRLQSHAAADIPAE
jgi:subfamily B ATP-binding cassette protein HlyB/CyaB